MHYKVPDYPEWAKRDGTEGSVTLYFFVMPDGRVKENVLVERTSGFSDFDDRAVARVGLAFDMKAIAWSQNLTAEAAAAKGVERVEKDELFRRADVLSVHLVLSARSRGLGDGIDQAVDNLLDEREVIALAGDPDHRLRAGGPHDQAPLTVEPLRCACNRSSYGIVLVGFAVAVADILRHLRQRFKAMAHRRHRRAELLDHRQHLESSDETIAGRRVV